MARDGGKDLAHEALLLVFRNVAVAEAAETGIWHRRPVYCAVVIPDTVGAMPELPEVETVRRGLQPVLEGRKLTRAETRRGDLRIPFPPRFVERLKGRKVVRLWRRAKYIVADLDSGESLIVHLGMSGRMTIYRKGKIIVPGEFEQESVAAEQGRGPHDHVVFETDAPARIVFTDLRRFGLMTLVKTDALAADRLFKDIGPEPLDEAFTPAILSAALKGKKTAIKAALLDQRVVAGIGNIYAERGAVLFRHLAQTHRRDRCRRSCREAGCPRSSACWRTPSKPAARPCAITPSATAASGYFQHRFAVYDREGQPCPNNKSNSKTCKGTIKRIVQGGRSTFYCPGCQK